MKAFISLAVCVWFCSGGSLADAQVRRITMIGGPPTGVFGIFATGISTYLSKSIPNLDVSHSGGEGAVANIRRVHAGEAEMGLSFASDLHEAFHGMGKFKGNSTMSVRAVGLVFVGVARLVTYADSRIQTVNDLAGQRVAVGAPGTGSFAVAERIFRALGAWDRITRVPLLGVAAGDALSDGKVDAFFLEWARAGSRDHGSRNQETRAHHRLAHSVVKNTVFQRLSIFYKLRDFSGFLSRRDSRGAYFWNFDTLVRPPRAISPARSKDGCDSIQPRGTCAHAKYSCCG